MYAAEQNSLLSRCVLLVVLGMTDALLRLQHYFCQCLSDLGRLSYTKLNRTICVMPTSFRCLLWSLKLITTASSSSSCAMATWTASIENMRLVHYMLHVLLYDNIVDLPYCFHFHFYINFLLSLPQ